MVLIQHNTRFSELCAHLLVDMYSAWRHTDKEGGEQVQKVTKMPNENSSGQVQLKSRKHFNTLSFFK